MQSVGLELVVSVDMSTGGNGMDCESVIRCKLEKLGFGVLDLGHSGSMNIIIDYMLDIGGSVCTWFLAPSVA